jgi:EpsI family protein
MSLDHGTSATVLRLVRGEDNQLVNYWFFSEGRETASYIVHQIHLVLNQILVRSQPSVLVRLSTRIDRADAEAAQQRLSRFAEACIPVLRERLKTVTQDEEPVTGVEMN